MGAIQIMDALLSNKIAAGEVVERPSSVVKELVENAIDAESTSIEVFLKEAGLTEIRVVDNGKGMDQEDALLSFSRHATSKVFQEHDLFRIRTLGFRGEALASIASVSKVTMQTSNGVEGTKIELDGGRLISSEESSLRKGTDISIQQLFFNTPARLKYVKSIQTELSHALDLINRLAICYPSIAFSVFHNDQQLLRTPGRGDLHQVIAAIYGMSIAKKMIPFEAEDPDFRISGFVSYPEITRASKNYITLFVNGRWVKHFGITRSIVEAYHTFLPIDRYPIVILSIEGDPLLTDVNVHPAKHEIRLSKEKELKELVENTIRDRVRKLYQIPNATAPEKKVDSSSQLSIWNQSSSTPPGQVTSAPEDIKIVNSSFETPSDFMHSQLESVNHVRESAVEKSVENHFSFSSPNHTAFEEGISEDKREFPLLEVVGQIHGTYIVAQSEDGFYLIDQHAAQERIKYEFFKEKVGKVDSNEKQPLLIPLSFEFTSNEQVLVKERLSLLKDVGLTLEEFGINTFIVREHPTWFPKGEEESIIQQMIHEVVQENKLSIPKFREKTAIMMSCKRSIKANHYLTHSDMEQLLHDLRQCEQPYTCPHGRPLIVHFSTYSIEKMFKRIM
ncbi:DNA mismatch repair endonuclease MutL [Paenisporosarcina cavernae]|uniref:DNA mismatch repair protein MutL n=1 Tax=Paenisporosarcina cavernae TaxID=2320858 RepID=A0A385YRC5_9BACL|nr:DNA mismatch repair endonuclease MutL [Paenisporosarcina cavernae]AYC29315.1 DNA mismatch repair endonuclease MutL [Paenisporosarcina cavernae]